MFNTPTPALVEATKAFTAATASFSSAVQRFVEAQRVLPVVVVEAPVAAEHVVNVYRFYTQDFIYGDYNKFQALLNDAASLANMKHLTIVNMPEVTDVSMFRHIETLVLNRLDNVVDVSVLGGPGSGVKKLTLRLLPKVVSLSGIGGVNHLILVRLDNVTSIADLEGNAFQIFEANGLSKVSDISVLRNASSIALTNMPLVSNISALRGVKCVNLFDMAGVTDVSALRGVEKLRLVDLDNVSDVSMLRGVSSLSLHGLPKVTDVSRLIDIVPSMVVANCGCTNFNAHPKA